MTYSKPKATPVNTTEICKYGCGQTAQYQFASGYYCCSAHHNSCPGKRKAFSDRDDHHERHVKSLETRTRLGITKTSQVKGGETRRNMGFYLNHRKRMQELWATQPWSNNIQCPIKQYKNTAIVYQGTYEFEFLEELELTHGIDWLCANVTRGPNIWYNHPIDNEERLYMSDFMVAGIVHEIKSQWTWNKKGQDPDLESINRAKLNACVKAGYKVVLVIWKKEVISYVEE